MVDEALLDHPRLLARTRIACGKAKGKAEDGKEDCEVFDDADFYQQLLRDVIESRGDGAGGADDWMVLQREKRAKKKVDTKASKGRKLRYVYLALSSDMPLMIFPVMRYMRSSRTSWSLCRLSVRGMRSKLMSSLLRYWERVLKIRYQMILRLEAWIE
jgi:hypothetical protein